MQLSKEKIKFLAKLHQKKNYLEHSKVVVEGFNIIQQLISNGIFPIEVYSTKATTFNSLGIKVPCYECTEQDLTRICSTKHPQNLAALYNIPYFEVLDFTKALYLDGIGDPGNLGTIFRIAAAFDFDSIFLSPECCHIYEAKVIRASLGSVFWIPNQVIDYDNLLQISALKICMDQNGSHRIEDFTFPPKKSIYIIGSEAHGISPVLKQSADYILKIRISTKMESLNAAICTAILAYCSCKY